MSEKVLRRNSPKYSLLVYIALTGMMTNFIEEHVIPDKSMNKQKIKLLTSQLHAELLKVVDNFFLRIKNDDDYDKLEITEQFHIATIAMEHFFRLSLQIEDLDDMKKQGLVTQLNILLVSYGLETIEIPVGI
jgi:hypothetical protein